MLDTLLESVFTKTIVFSKHNAVLITLKINGSPSNGRIAFSGMPLEPILAGIITTDLLFFNTARSTKVLFQITPLC
jgi:hypothetical protein